MDTTMINKEQGQLLLQLARETLGRELGVVGRITPQPAEPIFEEKRATFVTLKIGGQLRGCIGNLSPVSSVWDGVRENAINAAFHDSRFSPLAEEELARIEIDISILTNSQPLDYNDGNDLQKKLRPHIDGVILSDGYRSATFLPQVWDQLPDATSFLDHLCLKAGLPRGAWQQKKLDIRIYQVQSFAEEE